MKPIFYFIAFQMLFNVQISKAVCPEIGEIKVNITDTITTTTKIITYQYSFKNIGTDTLFIKDLNVQNYVSPDSSYAHRKAAGGYPLKYTDTSYILPGQSYSGITNAYPFPGDSNCPYLIPSFYSSKSTCYNNYIITRIVIEKPLKINQFSAVKITWFYQNNQFRIEGITGNFKYSVYDLRGIVRLSGIVRNNENIPVPLHSGMYYIEVYNATTRFSRKIRIE